MIDFAITYHHVMGKIKVYDCFKKKHEWNEWELNIRRFFSKLNPLTKLRNII